MKIKGLLLALGCLAHCAMAQTYTVKAEVHFENFEKVIVSEVERAKESIYVHIYKFNSKPIAQALIDAKKRGVKVLVMTDGKEAQDSRNRAKMLSEAGVLTYVDSEHATMHNKTMVIDRDRVVTGSFNYTKKADRKNAENILVLTDSLLRDRYLKNWQEHRDHSLSYADFVKKIVSRY